MDKTKLAMIAKIVLIGISQSCTIFGAFELGGLVMVASWGHAMKLWLIGLILLQVFMTYLVWDLVKGDQDE